MKLCFPEEILRQHLAVLGKTGAGKSSALRHIVEHLLQHNKRVCVIDPKGDWWGLKKSADGNGAGLPVIAFGDFRNAQATDVPINAHSGKHVAELVAGGNRPCIIGFGGWPTGQMVKFWIDFASALFALNSGELYLVGDEFHNFAPKGKIMDPEAGKCLHWSNRLMSEGRGCGLVCLIASQRPQKVHNDALTCCETLVAMRVTHKADRSAAQDWIEGCGDMEKGKEVLNSLAGMARGEAFVWSPEISFGPKRITFPMFETFDSFAPPQLQKKISGADWASVDLDEVKAKLASVIEEQKANDPAVLKAEVRRLKAELDKKSTAHSPQPTVEVKEVPVLAADERAKLEQLVEGLSRFASMQEDFQGIVASIQGVMGEAGTIRGILQQRLKSQQTINPSKPMGSVERRSTAENVAAQQHRPTTNGDEPKGGLKRMLVAIRQRQGINKKQLGVRAGLSSSSGTFGTYLAKLRSHDWIYEQNGGFWLTEAGAQNMGDFEPLPEGEELQKYWLRELGQSGAARMFESLLQAFPNSMTKEKLGEAAGISHSSGTFGTYLAKLRTLELVEGKSELKASAELFQ